MAVTILQRPLGFILGSGVSATINEAYAGFATVNKASHGLVDGDYVYIESNIENYNGFWYVNQEDTGKFKFRQYATATDVAYVQDATITYYKATSTHGWNCVHLPITYRMSTTLFPTNNADTSRTISSFAEDAGYVNLNLSGSIDSGPYPEPYEFIKISGATNPNLDGVHQIIEVVSTTSITINLAYDSSYQFGSATVIRYYNNYNIVVRVYGGINSTHRWVNTKPYELLATLYLIPDDNNEVFFSISDILKEHIAIENNLTLNDLPNNTDFWTQFYVTVAESYDDSLGSQYALNTFTSDFTSDQGNLEGVAANAMLPFKNTHSGSLSEYVALSTSSKFLTLFDSGFTYFPGYYNEVSFIAPSDDVALVLRQIMVDGNGAETTTNTALGTPDKGIIRAEFADLSTYVSGAFYILEDGVQVTETKTITVDSECDTSNIQLQWLNYLGGFDTWVFTGDKEHTIEIGETNVFKKNIFVSWPKSFGKFADTIEKETMRSSRKGMVVTSQYVTEAQLDAIKYIKTSPVVQIITSRQDRRTVLVDADSFSFKKDRQDLFDIRFTILFTDEIGYQK